MIIMPAISPSPNPSFGLGWDLGQLGLGLGYDSGRGEKVVNTVAGKSEGTCVRESTMSSWVLSERHYTIERPLVLII